MLRTITLLAAITGGLWIDVPFTKQEKNGCGAASVWMVMQYWKKSPDPPEEIHRFLYSQESGGVFAADMESYLVRHGFKTFVFTGEWNDLVENISNGRPLIVCLGANSRGAPLHYVVVAGVQELQQVVLINDPAQRKLWPLPRSEFEERWAAMGRWTLLTFPEEPGMDVPPVPAPSTNLTTTELREASDAFRRQDYNLASRLAGRAVRLDPGNPTANDLLATLYFLQDNLEAALKYWNRVDEPQIREIVLEPDSRWNPILLERTVPVSRASLLRLSDYTLARKRLDASGAFSAYAFALKPAEGAADYHPPPPPKAGGGFTFDLSLQAADRGSLHWVSWLRGLPYRTIAPEFINVSGRAINITSLWRWDANKRRAFAAVSAPASVDMRYHVALDVRDENWEWKGDRFRLWRQEIDAGVTRVATSKLTWSTGAIVSRRSSGLSVRYSGAAEYDLWSVPERRFTLTSEIRGQIGRVMSHDQRFARVEPGVRVHWMPRSQGKDYETTVKVRVGRLFGETPFDELFSIGLDRDGDLRMRAHPATRDGRKGAGLAGPRYVLWNSVIAKTVFGSALVNVKLAPFADVARVGGWFVDTGVEVRLSVASWLTISLSAGRDLKSGRNVLFTDVTK